MARFLIPSTERPESGLVRLGSDESRHAIKVLRLRKGHSVELLDARGGAYDGIVIEEKDGCLRVAVTARPGGGSASQNQTMPVDAAVALIKPEAMDWAVGKLCELGVRRILPVVADRCVVRLNTEDKRQAKTERWSKIALQSCKQCGRLQPLEVLPVRRLEDLTATFAEYDRVLLPTLTQGGQTLATVLRGSPKEATYLYLIGPEGDFTPQEVERTRQAGALTVTLGSLTLRAETAALYVAAVLREVLTTPSKIFY